MAAMRANQKTTGSGGENTAAAVRRRIEAGGERLWRLADFDGMPFTAVAQTLSRLVRRGVIQRLGKGLYYRATPTAFGPSRPNARSDSVAAGSPQGRLPCRGGGGQPARFHHAEPGAGRSGDGRSEPAPSDRRQGDGGPHAAAGILADALRDGRGPARLSPQPGRVERAVSRGDGGKAARTLLGAGALRAPASGSPRRNRRASARCWGPSASSLVSRKADFWRCGRV